MDGPMQVVGTGVANSLQGVVLAQQADAGAALSVRELSAESGLQPSGSKLHLVTAVLQIVGEHLLGMELLVPHLWMVIDIIRYGEQR